jgi:biopolymer transport protein ExbD
LAIRDLLTAVSLGVLVALPVGAQSSNEERGTDKDKTTITIAIDKGGTITLDGEVMPDVATTAARLKAMGRQSDQREAEPAPTSDSVGHRMAPPND